MCSNFTHPREHAQCSCHSIKNKGRSQKSLRIVAFYPPKILIVFLPHFDKIWFTPLEIPVAVSPAKRGIERLETERGTISHGAYR
jgi:hypothetical protein